MIFMRVLSLRLFPTWRPRRRMATLRAQHYNLFMFFLQRVMPRVRVLHKFLGVTYSRCLFLDGSTEP